MELSVLGDVLEPQSAAIASGDESDTIESFINRARRAWERGQEWLFESDITPIGVVL
jgi:hypothetical protein